MFKEENGQTWVGAGELATFASYGEPNLWLKWEFDQKTGNYRRTNLREFRESYFLNTASRVGKEVVTLEDAIRRAEKGECLRGTRVRVASDKYHVYGDMDEFEAVGPIKIVITEDKEKFTEGAVHQVKAYSLALRDSYNPGLPILCRVRNSITRKIHYEKVLTDEDEVATGAKIENLHSTLRDFFKVSGESQLLNF